VLKNRFSVTRVLGLMVLIGAVGAMGLSALPNAAAMPHNSPSVTTNPGVPVVEGSAPTIILTTPADGSTPTLDVRIGFAEPPSTGVVLAQAFPVPSPPGGDCSIDTYVSGAGSYWIFISAGTPAEFDMMSATDTVSILFATGVINPIYGGTATGPASGSWVDQNLVANKAPSIDFLATPVPFDPYTVQTCGFDTNGGALNNPFQNAQFIFTQLSMAGEIIPIDATALVLGGISTPTMMLPLLAIAAGGAFVYLRFQVLRKD